MAAGQLHPARRRVQRGEELVLGHHARACERVEQRALARVGVAHHGDDRDGRFAPPPPVLVTVFLDVDQLALEEGDAPVDLPAVHLQLGFAGAAHAHPAAGAARATAGLARQVRPRSGQARQPVLVLGQFHLDRAFARARMAGEDVEDQRRAVDDLDLFAQRGFQFALLPGRQLVVEDHDVGAAFQHGHLQLFQLAGADEGGRIGRVQSLGHSADHRQPRRVGQKRQFLQRVLERQQARQPVQLDADEHCALSRRRGRHQSLLIANDCLATIGIKAELLAVGRVGAKGFGIGHMRVLFLL